MPAKGRRYRLYLYTYTLNRWWGRSLIIGVFLLVIFAALSFGPLFLPQFTPLPVEGWALVYAGSVGVYAIIVAAILFFLRNMAYVQPFDNHLRLVTPFLRMNISYRRLVHTYTSQMGQLFPPGELKGRKRGFVLPLAKYTAVVLELKGLPASRGALRLFLSPFFFLGKTSRLVLLVPGWMDLSNELESFRSLWVDSNRYSAPSPQVETIDDFPPNQ